MKRRLNLAIAFAGSPKVLLLDEPSSGCDSWTRELVRKDILLRRPSTAVLVSTHHIDDVEVLSDRVWFLNERFLAFNGSLDELTALKISKGGDSVSQTPVSSAQNGHDLQQAEESSPDTGCTSSHSSNGVGRTGSLLVGMDPGSVANAPDTSTNMNTKTVADPDHAPHAPTFANTDRKGQFPKMTLNSTSSSHSPSSSILDLDPHLQEGYETKQLKEHSPSKDCSMHIDLQFSTWTESVMRMFVQEFSSVTANSWLIDRYANTITVEFFL